MNPQDLWRKAERALQSATALMAVDDADGACNRAYYAMFDAARAALLATAAPVPNEIARTHNGLITAFSLHLVKTGRVSIAMGKAFNKVEDLRLIADYKDEPLALVDAEWAVVQARDFLAEIGRLINI